jgi:hypothetical protein
LKDFKERSGGQKRRGEERKAEVLTEVRVRERSEKSPEILSNETSSVACGG